MKGHAWLRLFNRKPEKTKIMKLRYVSIATVAAASLLLSSCYYGQADGYGTFTYSTNGYSSSAAWTNASYDANGFPIFGYYYGRPVYGYTEAGVAIFTIAALTALCFVPHWHPAPWYHGHWHYPAHIHRVAAPPHCPPHHHPGVRPAGGINAPIHKNPGKVFGNPPGGRPIVGNNGFAQRPNMGANVRPNMVANMRPNMGAKPQPSRVSGGVLPMGRNHGAFRSSPSFSRMNGAGGHSFTRLNGPGHRR